MRKLLTILLLIPVIGISQVPQSNWDIMLSADKYFGRRVGTGSCQELRDSVLMDVGMGIPDSAAIGYYHLVLNDSDSVFPGDLVILKNVVVGSSLFENHVGIIYGNLGVDNYLVIHQNVGVAKLKDSKVVITQLDLSTVKNGLVEFHRVVNL